MFFSSDFVVGDTVGSWDEADKWCTDRGFKLASIHDAEDNVVAAAMGLALGNDMWLGGRRSADGDFEWSDGTAWDYEWWYPGEPNNQNEKCLMLYQSAMWNDRNCDKDGHRALCTATSSVAHVQFALNSKNNVFFIFAMVQGDVDMVCVSFSVFELCPNCSFQIFQS